MLQCALFFAVVAIVATLAGFSGITSAGMLLGLPMLIVGVFVAAVVATLIAVGALVKHSYPVP